MVVPLKIMSRTVKQLALLWVNITGKQRSGFQDKQIKESRQEK